MKKLMYFSGIFLVAAVLCSCMDYDYYNMEIEKTMNRDIMLKNIIITEGTLDSVFNQCRKKYSISTDYTTESISVTAFLKENNSSLFINNIKSFSGLPSQNILLKYGNNLVNIKVINKQMTKEGNYYLEVYREYPPNRKSNLSTIETSEGLLNSIFDPYITNYNILVDTNIDSIRLKFTSEFNGANIAMNDICIESGIYSEQINLQIGENKFLIQVKGPDGTQKEYTLTITRFNPIFEAGFNTTINDNIYELQGKTTIKGDLIITETNVENFDFLESLIEIEGDLIITNNTNLKNILGLKNIKTISGDIQINNNNFIFSLVGLENIEVIDGNIDIGNNPSLENLLDRPSKLKVVNGNINIFNNEKLHDLICFENIEIINGDLIIQDNYSLNNLFIFNNLETLNGSLKIINNSSLEHLYLNSLKIISNVFNICGNNQLNEAEVEKVLDQLEEAPRTIINCSIN